jgi:hypothetical protein
MDFPWIVGVDIATLHTATETGASFMLGSFRLCSLQSVISLAQPVLQHLNVGPWHETIIAGHDYPLSEALDNGFPLLRRQRRQPKSAALLLVLRKKPFHLTFHQLPGLTSLLLGSSLKLALCGRSVHAAPFAASGHRLPSGLELPCVRHPACARGNRSLSGSP